MERSVSGKATAIYDLYIVCMAVFEFASFFMGSWEMRVRWESGGHGSSHSLRNWSTPDLHPHYSANLSFAVVVKGRRLGPMQVDSRH